jgi:hypothetical protein
MRTKVEMHPASKFLPPSKQAWRVLLDGLQHSVHETEAEALAAERKLKRTIGDG